MSKITYKEYEHCGAVGYECYFDDDEVYFGKIFKHDNHIWYFKFREGTSCSLPKIFRAIAGKLEELNGVENNAENRRKNDIRLYYFETVD